MPRGVPAGLVDPGNLKLPVVSDIRVDLSKPLDLYTEGTLLGLSPDLTLQGLSDESVLAAQTEALRNSAGRFSDAAFYVVEEAPAVYAVDSNGGASKISDRQLSARPTGSSSSVPSRRVDIENFREWMDSGDITLQRKAIALFRMDPGVATPVFMAHIVPRLNVVAGERGDLRNRFFALLAETNYESWSAFVKAVRTRAQEFMTSVVDPNAEASFRLAVIQIAYEVAREGHQAEADALVMAVNAPSGTMSM